MCYFSEPLVISERHENVCLIAINRPEKRNCVNQATAQQLCEAVESFEQDEDLRVAVLYGKGWHAVKRTCCSSNE